MPLPVPDVILTNLQAITFDEQKPFARTIGIKKDRIVFVGEKEVTVGSGNKIKVIDCSGKTALPGFIDAHLHLFALVHSLMHIDLSVQNNIRSVTDMVNEIKKKADKLPSDTWIRGRGYDEFYLKEKRHPTRHDLDHASTHHPIKISHRTGLVHVLNTLALKKVGIHSCTPDPPEGIIDRDYKTGEPTGILYGLGEFLAERIPPLGEQELEEGIKKANELLLAAGITSCHEASAKNGEKEWNRLTQWKKLALFSPRVIMMTGYPPPPDSTCLPIRDELSLGPVKVMISEITGVLSPKEGELVEIVSSLQGKGKQVALHALEEEHIFVALKAIKNAQIRFPQVPLRHRIEHCSLCPPTLAKEIAKEGIVVVTQPGFIYYYGDKYLSAVPPEKQSFLYPLKTLRQAGVTVAGSSDTPVSPINPLVAIYGAVSRCTHSGSRVAPSEAITVKEALAIYTKYGAVSASEEWAKGSLSVGKFADIVLLDRNPLGIPLEEIRNIRVIATIIGGKMAWIRDTCQSYFFC